jgi:hypothetical protein
MSRWNEGSESDDDAIDADDDDEAETISSEGLVSLRAMHEI